MSSNSSQALPEDPFQNEPPVSPSTTASTSDLVNRDSSLKNMFDGLHTVDTQFDQFLNSPYFTAKGEPIRQSSQDSLSNYDTDSLREELDGARLTSPATRPKRRVASPILVETVNEESCHQTGSFERPTRTSVQEMPPFFPAPVAAPPSPPPSSAASSTTTVPFSNTTTDPDFLLQPPNIDFSGISEDSDIDTARAPNNIKFSSVTQHSEIDDSSNFVNFDGIAKLDNRIASLKKASFFKKSNNVESRRSSEYDPHTDSLRRELEGAAFDAPSVAEDERVMAPLDEDEYWSSQELSKMENNTIMVPQENEEARKHVIFVAALVGCICFWLIWILAMIIVLISR